MTAPDPIAPYGDSVRVRVRVQPRASRTELSGLHGGALRVRISSPPVGGAANDALIRFLAKRLGVPRSALRIASGASSRNKLVEIEGLSASAVRAALGL